MKSFVRQPATIISLIALFVAAGGTGYAASKIDTQDIAAKAVTGGKIAKDAIKGSKVRDNAISGNKIDEASLGEVPSAANATNAQNAANASNVSYTKPFFSTLALGDTVAIESNGQVSVSAQCVELPAAGDTTTRIIADTTAASGTVLNGVDSYDGSAAGGFMTPDIPAGARVLLEQTSAGQPGQTDVDGIIDRGFVFGPDGKGLSIDAETAMLGVNYLGARCVVAGMISELG